MQSDPDKLIARHRELVHSQDCRVVSHVQRKAGTWIVNTVMIEGVNVPFRYRRKKMYRDLKGARVNLTYYPATDVVANIPIEIMTVVRIKRA
jgi:hypothetical protein